MEKDKPFVEKPPYPIEDKPALELAWRGLVICIGEGQMTRKQAREMLQSWDDIDTSSQGVGVPPEGEVRSPDLGSGD